MSTVLLVSEQRMKQWNTWNEPGTTWSTGYWGQQNITTVYLIAPNTLTTNESTFLKDYIGPCLMQYALYMLMPALKYKMVEKGILNGVSEETQPTTLDEMKWLQQNTLNTAEFYNKRMLEFLQNNPNMFPLYKDPTVNDGMRPNRDTPFFAGLQTNVPINRNDLYIYADCDCDGNPDCGGC